MAPSPTPFPTGIWNHTNTSQRLQREGKELKAIGDYISALRKFDEAITYALLDTSWKGSMKQNTGLFNAFTARGDTYRDMNMHWEAIDDYTKAIGIIPIGAWYSKRGREYEKLGLTSLAQKDFNEACRLDSAYRNVLPCY
jgi:tetratricopeptide (TPR) repeat protein